MKIIFVREPTNLLLFCMNICRRDCETKLIKVISYKSVVAIPLFALIVPIGAKSYFKLRTTLSPR